MKKGILLILFIGFLILSFFTISSVQTSDYSGVYIQESTNYKYVLTISKIDKNIYQFNFDGWNKSYDNFIKDTTNFHGKIEGDQFVVEVDDAKGHYDDLVSEPKENSLYYEGEERCNIYFEFGENEINVLTESCRGIYGSGAVQWKGTYLKLENKEK